ncbi:MAG TPA: YqgE/AlgH family protein [Rhodobacteraceae bacterium]|nr:YqgE/AlgH family protein [Paracoccaceae bacterium]
MDLTGKLLIAMPGMGDLRFDHSVVFLCSHSESGAMGLIINKPAQDVRFADLLAQLEIVADPPERAGMPVYFGGPVEGARGFVLHSAEYDSQLHSMQISDRFAMTATLDILEDIALDQGPARALLMLGYAGWGPNQLEQEIAMNGWLTTDADPDLVFAADDAGKWSTALKEMGVDPLGLSATAGRA